MFVELENITIFLHRTHDDTIHCPTCVTLDGNSTSYNVVDTTWGREVRVVTTTGQRHSLEVTIG